MDNSKGILVWVAGFAGVLLLYGAYKDKNPLAMVTAYTAPPPVAAPTTASSSATTTVDTVSGGYTYDRNGNVTGTVPPQYANSAPTYIPPG